jgi:hypothetical protein
MGKHLVGIWKFKTVDCPEGEWCCTFTYKGFYYDTYPEDTMEEALDAAWDQLIRVRKPSKKKVGKKKKKLSIREAAKRTVPKLRR